MNLTQLLVTQQNVDEISARFGLTEVQTLEVMNAVLPAFSEGLKRQTNSPQGAAGFLEALASGHHVQYADHPGSAMEPDWTCPTYVPVSELIYAAFRSNAKGLLPPSDE